MSRFVIDASVALKWFIAEPDSADAVSLRHADSLLAPDLIAAEVGNALWKVARRGEITADQALVAARLMEQAELDLRPMRALLARSVRLAMTLDHPVYDCVYLALAAAEQCPLVTADERLARKMARSPIEGIEVMSIPEATRDLPKPVRS